ncbi:retinol dehydrogenase 12-like [Chelonus insularis]|uniref:retinol dehydrogenase 12-like n=1 Tax=Chelonus insularis TaxID=460826 RepID=UPI00158B4B02|nr:retinol dehydrogenase 12-like [Chelonus insularis]
MEIGIFNVTDVLKTLLGILLIIIIILKLFAHFTMGVCKSKKKMTGKTVLLTGCVTGIGKEIARDLAGRGARLIMADVNYEGALKVKEQISAESGNKNIVVKYVDMSSFKSIRSFAEEINKEETQLDVLIHNAGTVTVFDRKLSEDGIEYTMAVNFYGPFLLTHLLIDLLKRSAPSRIVITASLFHHLGWLDLNDPCPKDIWFPAWAYMNSKLASVIWTLELAKRLKGTGVTVNCLHPGLVDTPIWHHCPTALLLIINAILSLYAKTPQQGAQTTIHLAVAEELKDVSGKYFMDCKEYGLLTKKVTDPSKGKKFWEICEKITQLQPSDPKISSQS